MSIGGDLTVSALTVPAAGGAGAPIVVHDTTTNKGSGDVGPSVARFYLSTNASLDATDTLLAGSRAVQRLSQAPAAAGPRPSRGHIARCRPLLHHRQEPTPTTRSRKARKPITRWPARLRSAGPHDLERVGHLHDCAGSTVP